MDTTANNGNDVVKEAVKRSASEVVDDTTQADSCKRLKSMDAEEAQGNLAEEVDVASAGEIHKEVAPSAGQLEVVAAADDRAESPGEHGDEKDPNDEDSGAPEAEVVDPLSVPRSDHWVGSPIITLIVGTGESKVRLSIHQAVLEDCSPYFEGMFRSGMKEAETHVVFLPDESAEAVENFTVWAYENKVHEIEDNHEISTALDSWLLGDKWKVSDWQDRLIDAMSSYWEWNVIDVTHVRWATDVCQSSLLSTFLQDSFKRKIKHKYQKYKASDLESLVSDGYLSVNQLLDAARRCDRCLRPKVPGLCKYHLHDQDDRRECPLV